MKHKTAPISKLALQLISSEWFWPVFLILSCLIVQAPRIFLGLSLGDAGHHLARQHELVFFGSLRGSAAVSLLSNIAGGLWLRLFSNYGLVWVGLGGALINSVNALLCYAVLRPRFGATRTAIAVALTCGLITAIAPYSLFIDHYTFPALLGTLIVVTVDRAFRSTWWRSQFGWAFIAGLLIGALPFARIPMIVFTALIMMVGIWGWGRTQGKRHSQIRQLSVGVICGVITAFLIIAFGLFKIGLLTDYVDSLYFTFSSGQLNDLAEYSPAHILPKYLIRGIKATIFAGFWLTALYVIHKYIRLGPILYVSVVALSLGIFFVKSNGPTPAVLRFREVLFATIFLYACVYVSRNRHSHLAWLFVASSVYASLLALGSTFALQPAVYGLWFALPFAVLSLEDERKSELHTEASLRALFGPLIVTAVVLLALVCFLPYGMTWHDLRPPALLEKTEGYRSLQLKNIQDLPNKVQAIDAVLSEIQRQTKPGDFCLFFNHIAMLYVLTGTRSCFTSPVLFHSRNGVVQAQMGKAEKDGRLPKLCVLKNTANQGSKEQREINRDLLYLQNTLVDRLGYRMFYEISGFQLYAPLKIIERP